jgi:hypothetical protein
MKYRIILIIIIILLAITGCKSSKKTVITDINQTETVKEINEEKKGISAKISIDNFFSNNLEVTRFEPIYITLNGKDTVILKEVTYKQTNTNIIKEEKTEIDTTSRKNNKDNQSQLIDNSSSESEFEGFDIIKSLVSGVVAVLVGPFKWILWIVAALLIIPIFRFIKRLFTKKEIKK